MANDLDLQSEPITASTNLQSAFCASLRSKKFFMLDRLASSAEEYLDATNHVWCCETQEVIGPDNRRVEADTIRSYFKPGPRGALDAGSIDDGLKALIDQRVAGGEALPAEEPAAAEEAAPEAAAADEPAAEEAAPAWLPAEREYCTGQGDPKWISTLSAYSLDRSYGSRHPRHRFSDPVISGCYHRINAETLMNQYAGFVLAESAHRPI